MLSKTVLLELDQYSELEVLCLIRDLPSPEDARWELYRQGLSYLRGERPNPPAGFLLETELEIREAVELLLKGR